MLRDSVESAQVFAVLGPVARPELTVNGELLYSKLKTGKFPDEQWAIDAVGQKA